MALKEENEVVVNHAVAAAVVLGILVTMAVRAGNGPVNDDTPDELMGWHKDCSRGRFQDLDYRLVSRQRQRYIQVVLQVGN